MTNILERDAPFTGIDVKTPAAVRFGYLRTSGGELPDWRAEPIVSSRHITGANITVVQDHGMTPAIVTYRISLDTIEEYRKLRARQMTLVTLTILGNTASVRGTTEYILGHHYEHLDGVLVADIDNVAFSHDGWVEADVTFWRAYNRLTGGAV